MEFKSTIENVEKFQAVGNFAHMKPNFAENPTYFIISRTGPDRRRPDLDNDNLCEEARAVFGIIRCHYMK